MVYPHNGCLGKDPFQHYGAGQGQDQVGKGDGQTGLVKGEAKAYFRPVNVGNKAMAPVAVNQADSDFVAYGWFKDIADVIGPPVLQGNLIIVDFGWLDKDDIHDHYI